MPEPIAFTCHRCGAPLHPTPGEDIVRCAYCGVEHVLPAESAAIPTRPTPSSYTSPSSVVTSAPVLRTPLAVDVAGADEGAAQHEHWSDLVAQRIHRERSPWRRRDFQILGWLFLIPGTLWTALAIHDGVSTSMKVVSLSILGFAIMHIAAHRRTT